MYLYTHMNTELNMYHVNALACVSVRATIKSISTHCGNFTDLSFSNMSRIQTHRDVAQFKAEIVMLQSRYVPTRFKPEIVTS